MGSRPYKFLVDLAPWGVVVEIGSERGEGSTAYLRDLCDRCGVPFYTVDIAPTHPEGVTVADGATFLRTLTDDVQVAYLDNHDYIFPAIAAEPWIADQAAEYAARGDLLDNQRSQQVHLEQAQLVHERSRPGSRIVIDDTYTDGDHLAGKGATAVPWLLDHGWRLLSPILTDWETGFAYLARR